MPGKLQGVLDRIHQHAAGEDWRQAGWRDEQIERWLDHAVGLIAKAAEYPDLKLPVRLTEMKADVKAAELTPGSTVSGALIVGKNIDLTGVTLENSVVLADGNVELTSPRGCVVVARGAIRVHTFSQYCVLVSGVYVNVLAADGSPQDTASNGSVILSRGWADVQSAFGSLIFAPEGIVLELSRDASFINAALVGLDRSGNRSLRVRGLPIEDLPEAPFTKPPRVVGLVRPDAVHVDLRQRAMNPNPEPVKQPTGVVLRFADRRYFASFGQPILDQDGKPVEALRGWQVAFADDHLAILSSATADVPIRLDGR